MNEFNVHMFETILFLLCEVQSCIVKINKLDNLSSEKLIVLSLPCKVLRYAINILKNRLFLLNKCPFYQYQFSINLSILGFLIVQLQELSLSGQSHFFFNLTLTYFYIYDQVAWACLFFKYALNTENTYDKFH